MEGYTFKVLHKAVDNGVVGELGAENWQTLTILARFMDKDGYCRLSQKEIGKLLKLDSKSAAVRRVNKLLNFRFEDGSPVVTREKTFKNGKWQSIYKVMPGAGFCTADSNENVSQADNDQGPAKETISHKETINHGETIRIIERERIIYKTNE